MYLKPPLRERSTIKPRLWTSSGESSPSSSRDILAKKDEEYGASRRHPSRSLRPPSTPSDSTILSWRHSREWNALLLKYLTKAAEVSLRRLARICRAPTYPSLLFPPPDEVIKKLKKNALRLLSIRFCANIVLYDRVSGFLFAKMKKIFVTSREV